MLLGTKSFFFFQLVSLFMHLFKMEPNLDKNASLWDVQPSRVCGLRPRRIWQIFSFPEIVQQCKTTMNILISSNKECFSAQPSSPCSRMKTVKKMDKSRCLLADYKKKKKSTKLPGIWPLLTSAEVAVLPLWNSNTIICAGKCYAVSSDTSNSQVV